MDSSIVFADGPLHVARFDGPDDGPMLVCVHGLGGSLENFAAVAPLLARRGPVVSLDLPGFGRTPPAGRGFDVPSQDRALARGVASVVDRPAVIVGNSLGGYLAMRLADTHPGLVRALVLLNPVSPASRGGRDPRAVRNFLAYETPGVGRRYLARRRARYDLEERAAQALELITADPGRVDPEVRARHVRVLADRDHEPWADAALLAASRSMIRLLARRGAYWRLLARITQPTLVIHGGADRLVPVQASRTLQTRRPDWDLVVLDGIGHVPHLEAPDDVDRAIGTFLDALPPASQHAVVTGEP